MEGERERERERAKDKRRYIEKRKIVKGKARTGNKKSEGDS